MTEPQTPDDVTSDPAYADAAALWNGMDLQAKSTLLRLVLDLARVVDEQSDS
jgi:hypothetical protein